MLAFKSLKGYLDETTSINIAVNNSTQTEAKWRDTITSSL